MAHLILEHTFDAPLTDEEHNRQAQRLDPCLEKYGARWVRSYLAADRRRMVCEFEAPDADAVRAAYRSANVNFDRVWAAEVYSRDQAPASEPASTA